MPIQYQYLFGPVPSRRLGRSLGVDLTPPKTCSYDCIFCQLGRTTHKTVERREYVPTQAVLDEIDHWFTDPAPVDVTTLAGSGEPTLHVGFGEVLRALKKRGSPRTVLLSNGSLFWQPEVREAAAEADVVKLSLGVWDDASLGRVNRPDPSLLFARILEGMQRFRLEFKGKIWFEIFLIAGINTSPVEVRKIAEFAKSVDPDRIQLNTAVRPPAEDIVSPVPEETMQQLARLFEPRAEVIGTFRADASNRFRLNAGEISGLLRRRPCSLQGLSGALGLHPNEITKYLGKLLRNGMIRSVRQGKELLYVWNDSADPPEENPDNANV